MALGSVQVHIGYINCVYRLRTIHEKCELIKVFSIDDVYFCGALHVIFGLPKVNHDNTNSNQLFSLSLIRVKRVSAPTLK